MPGLPEMLVILAIVLLIFGAGKLPAIGDALGRSIKNFRRSANGEGEIEVSRTTEVTDGNKRGELKGSSTQSGAHLEDSEAEADVVSQKK